MRIFIKDAQNGWVIVCDEPEMEEWFKANLDDFKYYGRRRVAVHVREDRTQHQNIRVVAGT
jgi:hypothetical protein